MGNLFHKEDDNGDSSITAKPDEVRNSLSKRDSKLVEEDSENIYYLSKAEINHLHTIFSMIYINRDGKPDLTGLRASLANEQNELIVSTIHTYLQRLNISRYKDFEKFAVDCCRVSGTHTLGIL